MQNFNTKVLPTPASEHWEPFKAHLGYQFQNLETLKLACVHKSFGNEHRDKVQIAERDNERLEFLGDAILDLVISQLLLKSFPHSSEGDLSKLRAGIVNEKNLAKIAKKLKLGDVLLLGKGEENTGGRFKESILASSLEALIAAIFTDGGFEIASKWIEEIFSDAIKLSKTDDVLQDHKTRLQEFIQAKFKTAPQYEVIDSHGPDHDKTFHVRLSIQQKTVAQASGKSKKEAEQKTARIALEMFLLDSFKLE